MVPDESKATSLRFDRLHAFRHFERFFDTLYRRYDERYVVSAPQLARRTRRLEWSVDSPAVEAEGLQGLDYRIRMGG